jgi:hypothetical protein
MIYNYQKITKLTFRHPALALIPVKSKTHRRKMQAPLIGNPCAKPGSLSTIGHLFRTSARRRQVNSEIPEDENHFRRPVKTGRLDQAGTGQFGDAQ